MKEIIKATTLIGIMALLAITVMADESYDDDGTMNIQEFSTLSYSNLTNFNESLIRIEEHANNYVYIFEMNLYVDYWEVDNSTGVDIEVLRVVPARLILTWDCYEGYDCEYIYPYYMYEFKTWWLNYYYDLITDYT